MPRTLDAGPPLDVEVDSGTVDDAGKMRRAAVRGEAPASHCTAYITCLTVVTLRNSRYSYSVASRLESICKRRKQVYNPAEIMQIAEKRSADCRITLNGVYFSVNLTGTQPYFRLP
ncbi:hypothetical protein ALC53_03525 [Atta colombica]|uniref:Uncharacterized protein n=1 Tax=Atta colombica TaxID=520822 RepID=A0A195BPF9_9HYME|nr:hypothetical protein ALC53_03525 [Atta colombica]